MMSLLSKHNLPVLTLFAVLSTSSCERQTPAAAAEKPVAPLAPAGRDYWYGGKAELNTYVVEQERYGEIRRAGQVMVFVTEDFSANKQVKLDAAPEGGDRRIPVLKLNMIRRFETGIYDYSIMQSVFTPTDTPGGPARSLKTTTSIQDWCGQLFVQCNAGAEDYRVQSFSYFESEGDTDARLRPGLLEDELWNLIRLNPDALTDKETTVLPSSAYARLRHKPLRPKDAQIGIKRNGAESELLLTYRNIPRRLGIRFETAFPHRILGWEETDNGRLSSRGVLRQTLLNAYWKHNGRADSTLRATLNPGF